MITDAATVESAVTAIFKDGVSVTSKRPVSGGCINQTSILSLSNGEKLFLKENSARFEKMFLAEAKGLEALRRAGGPRVPIPLAVHTGQTEQFILMEYIPPGRPNARHYENFGRAFAELHRRKLFETYGFEEDNFIGSTPQKNTPCESWIVFFRTYRLGYQIELAARQGLASSALVRSVESLMAKLEHLIPEPDHPSTLHGDLWSGNAMSDDKGDAVIIDPATYYGHSEADLAMTELFGRLPDRFYNAYAEIMPLDSGYSRERKTLYNLYHILNHLNLFGSSYASQALSMANRFL
jgi:protein-ribulosamine 3-kinase